MNRLLCDVDGVLLDWSSAFGEWIHKNKHPIDMDKNFDKDNVKDDTYCIATRYGISPETIFYYIKMFNESNQFSNLKVTDELVPHFLKIISEKWVIDTISSYSSSYEAARLREHNLSKVFEESFARVFRDHYQLDLEKSKKDKLLHFAKMEHQNLVFLDDKPENVQDGLDAGIESYLMLTQYNKNDKLANTYGATWTDIYTKLIRRTL